MLKQLKIYYLFVASPFVLLLLGATIFLDAIKSTIETNPHPQINFAIFTVILFGGTIIIFNARRLINEARSLVEFSGAIHAKTDSTTLQDMADSYTCDIACLLQMVATSGDRSISHQEQAALEHELSNVHDRLNRRNSLPQYLTGLLVGMGLLGTFIGLLATLGDITTLISSFAELDMATASPLVVFRTMIERMKAPMQSMAIAFSASMFGLLGSIILGLMMVGIRRLQSDIFSTLNSEIARHIEIALSFESISLRSEGGPVGDTASNGLTTKILLRIEERLAETARVRQRALSAEIDDFKQQRADMLHTLKEQTEASNNFRNELQQLGSQFATIFNTMEKGNSEISSQISELTVNLNADAGKTHKLLAMQVYEQKGLRETLDSYKIEEWLAEAARLQQRALSAEIDDFKQQRADMLRTLTEQAEASNNFRNELQQLGSQFSAIFNTMDKGNGEISNQISELTVHLAADAKTSHILLNKTNNNFRSELRQVSSQLGTIATLTEKGTEETGAKITELMTSMATAAKESQQLLDLASNNFRGELQQLGGQLGAISNITEKGTEVICAKITDLMDRMTTAAKHSHKLLDSASNDCRGELQQLGKQLGSIFKHFAEKGSEEICARITELITHITTVQEPPKLPEDTDQA